MLEILRFQPEMAVDLARCYNTFVADVPHCAPVAAECFADINRLSAAHTDEERIVVAHETGRRIVGFAHIAIAAPPTQDWHPKGEPGIIRFLAYQLGHRAAGAALLEAAERWFQEHERREVCAWCNDYTYGFYHLPFAHLSDRLMCVHALLGQAGYRVSMSGPLFDWHDFEPPTVARPDLEFELRVEDGSLRDGSSGAQFFVGRCA